MLAPVAADDPVRVLGKWKKKNPKLKGNI